MAKPKHTVASVAEMLIKDAEIAVKAGSRPKNLLDNYTQRLEGYVRPFFGKTLVTAVNHRKLKEFEAWLIEERELAVGSVLAVMSFVSVVLKLALDEDIISTPIRMPRLKQKDCPRPGFTWEEYRKLLSTMKKLEKASPPIKVRAWPLTVELRDFTTFMVNSFLRPGDAFALRHKDGEIKKTVDGTEYLKLTSTVSKTTLGPVVTMPSAVTIYRRLKARHAETGRSKPDDYVFLPERSGSRKFAMEIMRRQFGLALKEAGLETNPQGEPRTIYSLRHTAIMFRLLFGDVDLLTLARACRTSVEMIDRFYAKPLQAEMNIDRIHSMRMPSRLLAAD
ncbi:hypothetical protein [Caulobacter sp. S45]|uniref:hypothetical protein n=1 Tax=Caulobacter sp. S45 TaxID=1641861 RepID=UPI00131D8EA5|nr:hypothetical protein [Caulobacter sp. S45]